MPVAALEPLDQLVDGAGLVAAQLEVGDEREAVVYREPSRMVTNRRSYHRLAVGIAGPGIGSGQRRSPESDLIAGSAFL